MNTKLQFLDWLSKCDHPKVLEIGTKAWHDRPPRHNRELVLTTCPTANWLGVDMLEGDGVDIVADVHNLPFGKRQFDVVISSWTFEHIARPWLAAREIARVLKIGGGVFIETHHTFPLHDYPSDYFRFSIPALKELFDASIGMECVHAEYLCPAKVVPITNDVEHQDICDSWDYEHSSYLVVAAYFKKVTQ